MSAFIDRALAFLTPERRKGLYGLVTGIGTLLVVAGVITPEIAASAAGLVISVVEVASLLLGSYKARRWDWKAIYGGLAAVVVTLKVAGFIDDSAESHILDLLAHGIALLPLLALFVRTDPSTVTGEPQAELVARTLAPIRRAGTSGKDV